jgi:hypothetical protein
MDDLFDIMGLSYFASKGTWCSLNNTPCLPLATCIGNLEEGRCIYKKDNEDDETGDFKDVEE